MHCTSAHVVAGWTISYLVNQLVVHPLKEFAKYYNLWLLIFSPLVTYTLINYRMCKLDFHHHDLGNCIHKTLARSTTMMGIMFIISATISGYVFKETLILMCLGLCENNLNNSLPRGSSTPPMLLVFSITSSNCCLGAFFGQLIKCSKSIHSNFWGVQLCSFDSYIGFFLYFIKWFQLCRSLDTFIGWANRFFGNCLWHYHLHSFNKFKYLICCGKIK